MQKMAFGCLGKIGEYTTQVHLDYVGPLVVIYQPGFNGKQRWHFFLCGSFLSCQVAM